MISDLRATLQETPAPAVRWAAMMAWLKRWWPLMEAGAQEEALAYVLDHASRLPDGVREAPGWLRRELLWAPEHVLGVLPRRIEADLSCAAQLVALLGCWPALRVRLDARSRPEQLCTIPASRVAALWWVEDAGGEVSTRTLEWLGSLAGLEALSLRASSTGLAGWALDVAMASTETLHTLDWDAPLEPDMVETLAAVRALEAVCWGGVGGAFHRAGTPEAHMLAETIGLAPWGPALHTMRVFDSSLFAHHWHQLYTEALAARLTTCEVWGEHDPRFDRASWRAFLGRFRALERLELGFWHEPGEDLFAPDVIGDRLGALTLLGCGRANAALVNALCALETSSLEALSLYGLDAPGEAQVYRWIARARPALRRLEISGEPSADARPWLLRAAPQGVFAQIEAWEGQGPAQDRALLLLGEVPGCMPALRSLTLNDLAASEIEARVRALHGASPPLERLVIEAELRPDTTAQLLEWCGGGGTLAEVDLFEAEVNGRALDALAAGGASALEDLRLSSLPETPGAEAWGDLFCSVPWLHYLSVEADGEVAVPPRAAAALLAARALENLTLSPVTHTLATALRDALRRSNEPLRLRRVTLHAPDPAHAPYEPLIRQALAREILDLLRARAPGVVARWRGTPALEALV